MFEPGLFERLRGVAIEAFNPAEANYFGSDRFQGVDRECRQYSAS